MEETSSSQGEITSCSSPVWSWAKWFDVTRADIKCLTFFHKSQVGPEGQVLFNIWLHLRWVSEDQIVEMKDQEGLAPSVFPVMS